MLVNGATGDQMLWRLIPFNSVDMSGVRLFITVSRKLSDVSLPKGTLEHVYFPSNRIKLSLQKSNLKAQETSLCNAMA